MTWDKAPTEGRTITIHTSYWRKRGEAPQPERNHTMSPSTSLNIHRITRIETKRDTNKCDIHWASLYLYDAEGNEFELNIFCATELAEIVAAAFPTKVEEPL